MKHSPVFQKHYRDLNQEQREAVDAIEGPIMVLAGPGTGKTQVLTLRIANILRKTDTSPDSVLALTFTEAGVVAMRKRLVEIMGSDAYRVGIYTFHGFANDLINRYPDEYPRIVGSKSINDIDKITILKSIIKSTKLSRLKPFGDQFYYLHFIKSAISELKRDNISPRDALKIVKNDKKEYGKIDDLSHKKGPYKGKVKGKYLEVKKQIEKDTELAVVYRRYEEELREQKLYDYEDMIIETIQALKRDENFLLMLEEQYQYLLADEHQDANNSQNQLLELLSSFHESPNLFLVGDEKQAIYRFQGASLENFLYFTERFPSARVIELSENYRSIQSILDASHSLILKGPLSDHQSTRPLVSNKKGPNVPIEVFAFSRPEFEYAHIATAIRRLIDEGVEPPEVAILYRNNNDVDAIIPSLEREHIPYTIESDQSVLADIDIKKFITLLYAVYRFGNDERLIPALYIDFLGIDPVDIYKILRFRSRERISLYDLIKSNALLKKAGVKTTKKISTLYKKFSSWSSFSHNHSLLDTLEVIANESGFWGHIITHKRAQEKLDKYNGFIRDIEQLVETHREHTLEDLIEYFDLLEEHKILVKRSRRYTRTPSVRLMTVHRAKGLEFDYVYLPKVILGHWGNKRSIQHFSITRRSKYAVADPLSDERRLFYVGLTRSRLGVFISYSKEGVDGKEQLPAQFLEEIDKKLLSFSETEAFEKRKGPEDLLSPRTPILLPVTEQNYLRELFLEQGLSVTAINNYLRNPWEYFFGSLLRVPKAPTRSMLYGNAIHGALCDLFDYSKKGEKINKAYLLSHFREHLDRQPLSLNEYEEVLEKGEYSLSSYYDTHLKNDTLLPVLENEFSIAMQFLLGNGESITLRGVLDKVEKIDEHTVRVIDYKTGPIRSRNDILGKTKTSNGDYFRQLVFYKLLLSSFENGKYEMESGIIDFVEPDKHGRHRREAFTVSDKDVEELKELIKKVASEILELSFWDLPCDKKKSNFCGLYDLVHSAQA